MDTQQFPGVNPNVARQWARGFYELPSTGCPGCSDGRRYLRVARGVYTNDEVVEEHGVFCSELPGFGEFD